jgi:hypothetical protein
MKNILISILLLAIVLFGGCSDKKVENKKQVIVNSGKISEGIIVGKPLANYTFIDQFDKEHTLTKDVKKVIFVFTKSTGHFMRVYLNKQKDDYLKMRNIDFIADVSGMPSIIFKMFALPDLKKSKYSIMIIKNKQNSKRFRDEKQKDFIMIISLKDKIVQNVKFVANETDLKNELD